MPFTPYDFFAYLASGSLVVATVDVLLGRQWLYSKDHPLALDVFLVLLAYIVGHVIAQLSSSVFENLLVERGLLQPSSILMGKKRRRFPYLFWHYYKPLREEVRVRVVEQARSRNFGGSGEALFVHAFAVVKQDAPTLQRLDQFRNLYGFARNMAMSLLLVALLIGIGPLDGREAISRPWAWCALALGVVMLYRYLKFFRQYSYEVLVTYAEQPPPRPPVA